MSISKKAIILGFITFLSIPFSKNKTSLSLNDTCQSYNYFSRRVNSNLKNDSSFEYKFDKDGIFSNTASDEFEKNAFIDGNDSELVIENANKEKIVCKSRSQNKKDNIQAVSSDDSYENNDTFINATNMYSVGYYGSGITKMWAWCNATISKKEEGALWWKKTYIDKDFYSFDMACEGTLEVSLTNVPSNCDYDIRLYKLNDGLSANAGALNFKNYIAFSANGTGQDELISAHLTVGTYYVCVYSFQDSTYDNDNPYKLLLTETADNSGKNSSYYIDTAMLDGDIGALWVSDYKPLGITPVNINKDDSKFEFSNYDVYPFIRHLSDNYEDRGINYAIFYVWNLSTRAYISSMAQAILNSLLNYSNWANDSIDTFSVSLSKASLRLTVGGFLIDTINESLISQTAKDLLSSLGFLINVAGFGLSLVSFVTSFLLENQFQISRKNLIEYLVNIKSAFEIGKGSNEFQTIMLKFKYRFSEKKYIDWSPRYELGESNMYGEDYLLTQVEGSGINGKITGIKNVSELNSFLE